ncbi:MAG: hypothetical protein Q8L88_07715 [Bacteroidota bacterium]|nr:hypothetical protein [Bacteroidota bacterium]
MKTEALITISVVWTVIISLAAYFIVKVIRTPQDKSKQKHDEMK